MSLQCYKCKKQIDIPISFYGKMSLCKPKVSPEGFRELPATKTIYFHVHCLTKIAGQNWIDKINEQQEKFSL